MNGVFYLLSALKVLGVGSLVYKSKSNATFVLTVSGVRPLKNVVAPFWKDYISPTQSPRLREEKLKFFKVVDLLIEKGDSETFLYEILPLWDGLRKQKGQSNESFPDLASAQKYSQDFIKNKSKRVKLF